ncbi:universal stress protein [Bogoriella caseilytica]|uniref:Universal stress protein family protein n=1 Tax=Bogoriella caseilytica TaxID=56055 RepID=A0A3N2B935_9MICO|nr:universal stress protein [Bogoriella caseilytica]ROR71767.1 universal stress protein family protein [Bogoriella caseilytica]
MAVVVGYVTTPEGRAALAAAIMETRRRESRLVVVLTHGPNSDDESLDALADTVRDELDEADVAYEVRQISRTDDVAETLVTTAEDLGAELLVIGLRRRSPVGKLILGTNAQRILLDAPCPVLAVKPAES